MKKSNTSFFTKNLQQILLLRCLLAGTLFLLAHFAANAQCSASFIYTQTGSSIYFTNTSTTAGGWIYRSIWDFGDGSGISYTKNPTHTYKPGTYYVNLIIWDDSSNYCSDTLTDSIVVVEDCDASYSYTMNGYNATFSASTNFNNKTYYWQLRDYANFSLITDYYGPAFNYTFSSAGKYYIQLAVSDSVINCLDSGIYKLITITAPNCRPSFNKTITGANVYFYASPQMGKTFIWSFGDGTNSSTLDSAISHKYAIGTYWACLTAIDSASSCRDSVCKQIVIKDTACDADFEWYQYANDTSVYFDPPLNKSNTTYKWLFTSLDNGNNFSDSSASPYKFVYDFPQGRYSVCLTVTNSNCTKTYCRNIYTYHCKADFNASTTGLQAGFTNKSNKGSSTQFFWDFGDNSTSGSENPQHNYAASGTYTVCLVVKDSTRGCNDTVCKQISVTDTTSCNASFSISVSGKNVYLTPANNDSGTSYYWSFGDGNTHTGTNYDTIVTHYYAYDSTFQICLVVSNGNCSDTVCKSVIISTPNTFSISGNLYLGAGSTVPDSAIVYLINYDPSDSSLYAVDSIEVFADSSGTSRYIFTGKENGTYYVKAALLPGSTYYTDYFPTYHDSVLKWIDANDIIVNNSNVTADIYLVQGTNPGGSGFIGGKVSQGANKKEGDPLEKIQIMLFDENNNPVAYTYSNKDGNFSFSNLAFGTYEIYTEVTGIFTIPGYATLSATNKKVENVTVKVSTSGITTSIYNRLSENFLMQPKLFPNPTQNILYLETNMRKAEHMQLSIYTITGQEILSENLNLSAGYQTSSLRIADLPAGVYMLMLKNDSGVSEMHCRIIKY